MTNISKPIIFFGTEDFSLYSLGALIEAGYAVAGVITKPDSRKGRGQKLVEPAVKTLARKYNIPVWQPQRLADITPDIQAINSPIGVLVSYGKIIPQSIIDLFTPGIINIHPSLLPKYRGPSPIESTILHGDRETGVTIMQLSARMDAGPIYAYAPHELTGTETRPELYHTLGELGARSLIAVLPGIISGDTTTLPQKESDASYCQLLQKSDALLNPNQHTAPEAERIVRAYQGFPKSKLTVLDQEVIIIKAHVTHEAKTPLDILCRDGAYLSIDELVGPSGRMMSATDFLNGYAVG